MKDVISFTFKTYPPAICATQQTDRVIRINCICCHHDIVENIVAGEQPFNRTCWSCHHSIAHEERGLSFTPDQDKEVFRN